MKKLLLILASLIVVALAAAAILPKDFKIEQSIIVNKPKAEVFAYLKLMQNGQKWEPWAKMDPELNTETKGNDGEIGAIVTWSGNREVGVGEQEIVAITENERIDFELRFQKPMQTTNKAYLITEDAEENQTKVTWGMTGRTPFPFNLICNLMHGKVNKDFADGLSNLKAVLESPVEELKAEDAVKPEGDAEVKAEEVKAE
jgi:hypothetical protein